LPLRAAKFEREKRRHCCSPYRSEQQQSPRQKPRTSRF
jgi:hypothetical protein